MAKRERSSYSETSASVEASLSWHEWCAPRGLLLPRAWRDEWKGRGIITGVLGGVAGALVAPWVVATIRGLHFHWTLPPGVRCIESLNVEIPDLSVWSLLQSSSTPNIP